MDEIMSMGEEVIEHDSTEAAKENVEKKPLPNMPIIMEALDPVTALKVAVAMKAEEKPAQQLPEQPEEQKETDPVAKGQRKLSKRGLREQQRREKLEQEEEEARVMAEKERKRIQRMLEKKAELITKDLLVIILDIDPSQEYVRHHTANFTRVLNAVILFANAHLMQKCENVACIFTCSSRSVEHIYPGLAPLRVRKVDMTTQLEQFAELERTTRIRLGELLRDQLDDMKRQRQTDSGESKEQLPTLMPGAIGMALAYIARLKRGICLGVQLNSRILIVTGSPEAPMRYMNYMNMFHGAQKTRVVIDVCTMKMPQPLPLLRQATALTGGYYYNADNFSELGMKLLGLFLMTPQSRYQLYYPEQPPVDFSAWCVCHYQKLPIGFVCSSCFSVYCHYTPICTTCNTVFKAPERLLQYIERKHQSRGKRRKSI